MAKELGIIILNWNGRKLLEEFLPAAVRYSISDCSDLIVADNGSTDDSLELLQTKFPEVKVISLEKNYGFAEGYNLAIEQADYPYVLLLNSDVEVTEGWWQPLLDFMKGNPDVGAVQPKILSWREKQKGLRVFEYAGAAGGYLDSLGYPYCRGRLFDKIEEDRGQYDSVADVTWASGAALLTRRALYQELGGLDSRFFAHMEEIDLCCRILNAGWRVCAIPGSEVYHVGGASLEQGNPRKTYLNFRNNLLLLHKNLPKWKGRRTLFVRRLFDSLAFFMFVAKLDIANAKAIIRAHNDFRKMRSLYRKYPSKDVLSSQPGGDSNSVIARYLLGKKALGPEAHKCVEFKRN